MMPSEGFPHVTRNPFGRKPLEGSDADLLVGRDEVLQNLRWFLQEGNDARLLLLTGPSGSGRTSLMRVLKGSLQRSVHVVDVNPKQPASDLLKQIHQGLIGGEPPSGPSQATEMLIQTLRRDHGQALIVLDLPVLDGEHLPQILSKSMSYLERLDALIVVVATPENAARFGTALEGRFLDEFSLKPFTDEDIATMIDVRVRRQNQLGWRPRTAWIQEHLAGVQRQPRDLLRAMSAHYVAQQRGERRPSPLPQEGVSEPHVESWNAGQPSKGLELDMDDLEGAREQDAPPPIRPSLDNLVETDPSWMEDFKRVEPESLVSDELNAVEPTFVAPQPSQEPPPEPLVSRVKASSPFGRIAQRSINATNEEASAAHQSHLKSPSAPTKEPEGAAWEYTDNTPKATNVGTTSQPVPDGWSAAPVDSIQPAWDNNVLLLLKQALTETTAAPASPIHGLADALTRLGMPHAGALQHRPLRVQALRELSAGQAVVVEAASHREVSPSDGVLLARLGIKRARLSQLCNALHKDGVLDVAQRGRSRVFTLSTGARAQLKAWNLLGGEA